MGEGWQNGSGRLLSFWQPQGEQLPPLALGAGEGQRYREHEASRHVDLYTPMF